MAIAGLLVHTLKVDLARVEGEIQNMAEMTTYGCHQDQYVVVVAEAPANRLEAEVKKIKAVDGVLTIYTTYVTVEDEMDESTEQIIRG
ncbi:MAG: chaperone NapD [Desulfobacteraceae bacterium]